MSTKRGASDYITKDGLHDMQGQDDTPAHRATAAQLANRRIAQARGRSGTRHRTGASSQLTGFASPAGTGGTSQSFPPINGATSIGNGSANASFGGFGNSSSSFNFSAGAPVNNPFAQQAGQPATNGASGSPAMSFNFGGGQPQAPPASITFGSQSQQPTSNMFGSSQPQPSTGFGGFSTPSTNLFGATTSQPTATPNLFNATAPPSTQPPTGGFGGFGVAASAPATTTASTFGGFGSTAGQSGQQAFGGFGQSTPQAALGAAPSFTGFGQSTTTFPQTNGDAMQSTPESSPQKPMGWNKQTQNGILASPNSSGAESPDRPPHVEQIEDQPRPNVFAGLSRLPPELTATPKAADPKPTPTSLFSLKKPTEPEPSEKLEKQPEKEQNTQPSLSAPVKESTPAAPSNPFASLRRMPQSPLTPLADATSQAEEPKASGLFTLAPATSTQQTASPAKSSLFNPSTTMFTTQKPTEEVPATNPLPQKPATSFANNLGFASNGLSTTPGWGAKPELSNSLQPAVSQKPAPRPAATAPSANLAPYLQILPEVFREDNLPAPDPQRDLNEEEKKRYYQALKVSRLNKAVMHLLARVPDNTDMSPLWLDYISMMDKIKQDTAGNRLGELISTFGEVEGQKRYDQEQGRLPVDGTNKRKAAPAEDAENEKRAKTNGDGPQSNTASKFQSIFEQSGPKTNAAPAAGGLFGASIAAPTPTKASSIFAQAASTPAPAPSNLFGNATASAAKPTSSNFFGNKLATSEVAPPSNVASSLFSTNTSTTTASPASAFTGFKPSTSLSTTDTSAGPVSSGFKPVSSASSSTPSLPKFSSGSGNFLSQFSKNAEEEAKKAKKKAFDEDYDSDEETKAEWEARYDKELEEKRKQVSAASSTGGFKFTPTSSVAGSNAGSGDETEPKRAGLFLAPPAGGSAFGLSRSPSPATAASPDGSVFDQPRSSTPGNLSRDNPFAHLSRQASEKGDADDEQESADGDEQSLAGYDGLEEQDGDEDKESTPRATNGVIRRGPFEEDSEESQPETPKTRTDGLFGRVTRDTSTDRTPLATTEANQGSLFSTAGTANQIWTPKDPIKFAPNSTVKEGEKSAAKPLFEFTPVGGSQPQGVLSGLFSGTKSSTPSFGAFTTPKPASTSSLFPPSGAGSVFSTPGWGSRATTPGISDVSGAESTAGEGEEVKPDAQIDIADMAKDKEGHEVIFESSKVKASKYNKGDGSKDGGGDESKKEGWQVAGVGPIAVLKNEDSGVISMLMRTVPSGKIIINTRLTAVINAQVMNKRARFMIITEDGPVSYLISFQSTDDCKAYVDACKANGAK